MNLSQTSIFTVGLLVVCLLCARQVSGSRATVKDFFTLITYWIQLQQPLNVLGDCFRGIHSTLVEAERLIELLTMEPSIKNKPDAKDLVVDEGVIRFDQVGFSHIPKTKLLQNLTFRTPPGGTVAVVGPSGSGKSTILKLLCRFWDMNLGAISIEGQDVRNLKIESLRKPIGIVPQVLPLYVH
jgi:ABC-type transport system involved in Fe-S cluster assembly fused permease/ATPase subunit